MFVSMDPMLKDAGFDFLEFKTREGMECKVEPIFSVHPEITYEETFRCASEVQDSDDPVHFGRADRTDRT